MDKSAGNIPEFDDFEDPEDAERRRRIHRSRKAGKRKRPLRAPSRRHGRPSCG